VFVHGFAEHIGRYQHFHPLLAARGIAVFTFDQRGFGLTGQDTTGHNTKGSTYGKTSWKDQMGDIEWAVKHTQELYQGVPIFLMGHSMGGGEVLGFATQGDNGAQKYTVDALAGVIATSPLLEQTTPASKFVKWMGGKLAAIMPYMLIPAAVKAEYISHDAEVNAAYLNDPLVKQAGSLKGLHDMLTWGETILHTRAAQWPEKLPLLLVHGTEDKISSHKASQAFQDKLSATKKKFSLYAGGFHELHNEPDGVKDKLAQEIIAFIEEHSVAPLSTLVTPKSALPKAAEEAEDVKNTEALSHLETQVSIEPTGINVTKAKM
jgi:acylglycerol lipase